jgi:hypothetical protein
LIEASNDIHLFEQQSDVISTTVAERLDQNADYLQKQTKKAMDNNNKGVAITIADITPIRMNTPYNIHHLADAGRYHNYNSDTNINIICQSGLTVRKLLNNPSALLVPHSESASAPSGKAEGRLRRYKM